MQPEGILDLLVKIGGSIALVRGAVDLTKWWRNRGYIEIRILRMDHFVERYTDMSLARQGAPEHFRRQLPGMIAEAFSIIEFEIQNKYQMPITVFRPQIDDWIFSDRYVPGRPYGQLQDYLVYDLYSREKANLDAHELLKPDDALGRRIEIHEYASIKGSHSRRQLPERKEFLLRINATKGITEKHIHISTTQTFSDLDRVLLWSGNELTARPIETVHEGGYRP